MLLSRRWFSCRKVSAALRQLGQPIANQLNLALGSALASIGLTIPAVRVVSIVLGQQLDLGLHAKESVLLALTLLVGVITWAPGRTTVLQGIVHLVIFAAFLFLTVGAVMSASGQKRT